MPKTGVKKLLTEERRRETLALLERDGRVTVEELVRKFDVSAVTIRTDLEAMAKNGTVVRSHGGAVKSLAAAPDYPLPLKQSLHHAEKVRIARAAAQLVRPHETVILDSGTTTLELALCLKQQKANEGLTVITHALNVVAALADAPNLILIMVGGILRHVAGSFVGPDAERMIQGIHADHFFLAVDGLDPVVGLTTPDILEAKLNGLMIGAARETTVLADSSKFGRKSVSVISGLERVQRVITDRQAPEEMVTQLRDRGIQVVLA
jgi:DeoR/GlpR family transcriptional regulator of sugar metabolism